MTEYNYTNELYHYGRKGMKWGQHIFGDKGAKSFAKDVRVRSDLKQKAVASSAWSKRYDKTYKRQTKKIDRLVAKDKQKKGAISNDTKGRMEDLKLLEYDKNQMNARRVRDIKNLENHVNNMIKKYENVPIRSVKTSIKNGEKYVNTYLDNIDYKLQRRYVSINDRPYMRYEPVRTKYEYHYM